MALERELQRRDVEAPVAVLERAAPDPVAPERAKRSAGSRPGDPVDGQPGPALQPPHAGARARPAQSIDIARVHPASAQPDLQSGNALTRSRRRGRRPQHHHQRRRRYRSLPRHRPDWVRALTYRSCRARAPWRERHAPAGRSARPSGARCSRAVVHQDDGAVPQLRLHRGEHRLRVVAAPVVRVHGPAHDRQLVRRPRSPPRTPPARHTAGATASARHHARASAPSARARSSSTSARRVLGVPQMRVPVHLHVMARRPAPAPAAPARAPPAPRARRTSRARRRAASASRTSGVPRGSGPSSNVRATTAGSSYRR